MANVIMSNGDLTAVGRVTGAKVKVPTTADLEIGSSATLATVLAAKQDTISDLATIRSGADAGATAAQPSVVSIKPWVASTSYAVNAFVSYSGVLYVCKTANSDATFDETNWIAYVQIEKLALAYSTSSAYSVGDFCSHGGYIYQCNTAIASGGEAWTAAHWDVRDLSTLFSSDNTSLNASVAAKVQSICSNLNPTTSSIADVINALKGNN